ncbi:MAG: hypothetical protein KJ964_13640 [Verrucomicrobia bacterium]|nr:hypothetical protein [Verrucomicrobiota bacterium]MBU1736412.1 hypothetical protein [Verrucomicrobiota bacterium]MBU1855668.1 hypothetical protein [Verrucomicrobiota bacterium]
MKNITARGSVSMTSAFLWLSLLGFFPASAEVKTAQEPGGDIAGNSSAEAPADLPGPRLACPPIKLAPVLDGQLDDPAWQSAIEAGNFYLSNGNGFAMEKTFVYCVHDDQNLYVAFRCAESILDPVQNRLGEFKAEVKAKDGPVWGDDSVEIFLAPHGGNYYQIVVNSIGTVYDAKGGDASWDGGITACASHDKKAWYVEIGIPFAKLGKPKPGDTWRINFCRNTKFAGESSSWSPVPGSFHSPGAFGYLLFTRPDVAAHAFDLSRVSKQGRSLVSLNVTNLAPEAKTCALQVIGQYDKDEVRSEESALLAGSAGRTFTAGFNLEPRNRCMKFEVAKGARTWTAATSTKFHVKPNTTYHFSATVRNANFESIYKNAYGFFSCLTYDNYGNPVKSPLGQKLGYIGVSCKVPKTETWKIVAGEWKSPANAVMAELWIVAWEKQVSGTFWLDDLTLIEEGATENIIPNGSFPSGTEKVGWKNLAGGLDDSYGAKADECEYICRLIVDGQVAGSTPAYRIKMDQPLSVINSFLMYIFKGDGHGRNFDRLPPRELYICEGSFQKIALMFVSPTPNKIGTAPVNFQIDLPEGCRLLDYYSSGLFKSCPPPGSFKVENLQREGKAYQRYTLEFASSLVAEPGAKSVDSEFINLLIRADGTPTLGNKQTVYYRAFVNETMREEKEHELPLTILPPLIGKHPEKLPQLGWCIIGREWEYPVPLREELLRSFGFHAGYNYVDTGRLNWWSERDLQALCRSNGVKPLVDIPTPNQGPLGAAEYLALHPADVEKYFDGRKAGSVVAYPQILDKNSPYQEHLKKHLEACVRRSPDCILIDFEVHLWENPGFSEANIELFRARMKIPKETVLTPQILKNSYRREWVDFICWESGEFMKVYRQYIKAANSNCLFSLYAAYQIESSKEQYSSDLTYLGSPFDYIHCGYGGGTPEATRKASGKKYIGGGELTYGAYDFSEFENTYFTRLMQCGSAGPAWCDLNVTDGRFHLGVSRVNAVAADFEDFFLNYTPASGILKDKDGKERSDVMALTHNGEYLVAVFNNGTVKKNAVLCMQKGAGLVCIDYDTKAVITNALEITTEVDPGRVKILYLAKQSRNRGQLFLRLWARLMDARPSAPVILPGERARAAESSYPVLRWQDRGAAKKYVLEYARDRGFTQAVSIPDVPTGVWRVGPLPAGKYFWRVKSVNVLTRKESMWSQTGELTVPAKPAVFSKPTDDRPSNPGFERFYWCFGWAGHGEYVSRDYSVKHGKSYAIRFSMPDDVRYLMFDTFYGNMGGNNLIRCKQGEKYSYSIWVKTDGKSKLNFRLFGLDADGKVCSITAKDIAGGPDWQEFTGTLVIPSNIVCMGPSFLVSGKAGLVWVDDLVIKKVQ